MFVEILKKNYFQSLAELEILALIFIKINSYAEAEELLSHLINYEPHPINLYYTLGFALYKQNKYNEALTNLQLATNLDNNFVDAYWLSGKIYNKLKNIEKAIFYFEKAVSING